MNTIEKIQNIDGTWVALTPIRNLFISDAIGFEIQINKVTFINASKLARRRKRYGFNSPMSAIKKRYKGMLDSFFNEEKTFATLRLTGKGKDLKQEFVNKINDGLSIISLSQLGYSRRRHNACPAISDEKPSGRRSCLMYNPSTSASYQPNEVVGKIGSLNLDTRWHNYQKKVFFYDLLKIISGKTKVNSSWRKDITNAAILAGQSQSGHDIAQCFLWNIIALETLLTKREGKYSEKLPERTEAFIGWAQDWHVENFDKKIRDMYKKRSIFVHNGRRDEINIEDILFSDELLLNVFVNIVRHPKIFESKEKLIKFSEMVQAERTLGIRPKVRPKTFAILRQRYTKEDLVKI